MNDQHPSPSPAEPDRQDDRHSERYRDAGSLRSPIIPQRPPTGGLPGLPPAVPLEGGIPNSYSTGEMARMPNIDDPEAALEEIRGKMERVAAEFAQGKINRMQFNAIYGRYNEQRSIIQRLIERNPENRAWRSVATPGHTGFLRSHFESHPVYYVVFQHNQPKPLIYDGTEKPNGSTIIQILRALWKMPDRPEVGLARKQIEDNRWLVLTFGKHSITLVIFSLEPSAAQAVLVRDLHLDFERANAMLFQRGQVQPERMVFPQRALIDNG